MLLRTTNQNQILSVKLQNVGFSPISVVGGGKARLARVRVASSMPDLSIGKHASNPVLAINGRKRCIALLVGLLAVILQLLKVLFVIQVYNDVIIW
jgi:hypothetical protein